MFKSINRYFVFLVAIKYSQASGISMQVYIFKREAQVHSAREEISIMTSQESSACLVEAGWS